MCIAEIISTLISTEKYTLQRGCYYYPNVFVLTLDLERKRETVLRNKREFERQPLFIVVP